MSHAEANTVLLTLGRLPVALDIARSFAAAGCRVLVAEPYGVHLAKSSAAVDRSFRVVSPALNPGRYLTGIRNIIETEHVNLVVPVSEETLHIAALADSLPDDTALFCRPRDHVVALHDKLRFIERAQALELGVPQTISGDSGSTPAFVAERDVVIKPRHSASGKGIEFVAAGTPIEPRPGRLVQERLRGSEVSSFSIARDGRTLVTAVYRGTVIDGSVAVAFERVEDDRPVIEWAERFIRGTGHTGFIGFDFIVGPDGQPRAIECNPRATSGIHFIETALLAPAILGQDLPRQALRAERRLVESYSCFTVTLASLRDRDEFRRCWRELRAATDVTWSGDDPWPFLLMMVNTSGLVWRALSSRQSFAAAAVRDIEWHPERGN